MKRTQRFFLDEISLSFSFPYYFYTIFCTVLLQLDFLLPTVLLFLLLRCQIILIILPPDKHGIQDRAQALSKFRK